MPLSIIPYKVILSFFLLVSVSFLPVKGQNSNVTPESLKSYLIQFLKTEIGIGNESNSEKSFYLIDINIPLDSLSSHVVFPAKNKPEQMARLQIGFYKFGLVNPHLEPYLTIVSEESIVVLTEYSVQVILKELELFMIKNQLDFDKQLILFENVIGFLRHRQSVLDSSTPINDLILNLKN